MTVKIERLENEKLRLVVAGTTYLVSAECPHRKGKLAYGYVNERTLRISCPLHGSTFEITTGCQTSGPACGRLEVQLQESRARPGHLSEEADGTDPSASQLASAK